MRFGTGALLLAVALAAGAASVGCATSGNDTGGGGDVATSGPGGMAAAGGARGAGGDAGMGGAPLPCGEQPCKLVSPQCGCAPGDRCTLTGDGARVCAVEGTSQPLEFCVADCTAGNHCVNNGTTGFGGFCHQICEVDADCNTPTQGPGGICVLPLNSGGGTVCSQNCDPVSNTGCKEANAALKCDIAREPAGSMRWFTRCTGSGTIMSDGICTAINECSAGSSCVPVAGEPAAYCLAWCTNPSTGGVCPQGASHACSPFTTPLLIGTIEYGACIPIAGF